MSGTWWFDARSIGRRLQEARGERSQRELGERLGYLQPHVSRYERGALPGSYRFLAGLSALFDVDLNWLLTGRPAEKSGDGWSEARLEEVVRRGVRDALTDRGSDATATGLATGLLPEISEGLGLLPSAWDRLLVELPLALAPLLSRASRVGASDAAVSAEDAAGARTEPGRLLRGIRDLARNGEAGAAVDLLAAAAEDVEREVPPPLGLERGRFLLLWAWLIGACQTDRGEVPAARAAELLFRLARATRKAGRLEEAEELYHAAQGAADGADAPALAARCRAGLGHVRFARGDFDGARSEYVAVLESALRLGSPELLFFAYLDLASYYHEHEGRFEKALEYARSGLEIARRERDLEHVSLFLNEIGLNEAELGRAEAAEASFGEALEAAERLGSARLVASYTINRAGARVRAGDHTGAWELLRKGRDLAARAGLVSAECRAEILLARCEHAAGRTAAALERVERVEDRCEAQGLDRERELARALEREIRQGMLGRLESLTA